MKCSIMTDYEHIIMQLRKCHFTGWDDKVMRDCIDKLPNLSRQELTALTLSKWTKDYPAFREEVFNLLFKGRIEERDRKIKAMSVEELIENLHDENGYGKFIVLEMKDRFDSLDEDDKMKVIDTLSATTKTNQRWAEGKRKQMKSDK